MDYSMKCPVEGCDLSVHASGETKEAAAAKIVVEGDKHFAEAKHPMDAAMTPEAKLAMTMENMKEEVKAV